MKLVLCSLVLLIALFSVPSNAGGGSAGGTGDSPPRNGNSK